MWKEQQSLLCVDEGLGCLLGLLLGMIAVSLHPQCPLAEMLPMAVLRRHILVLVRARSH